MDLRSVHYFADGEEAGFVGSFAHELEARFAEALEGVRRSTGLESARAENFRSSLGDAVGNRKDLLPGFDGARAGGNDNFIAADFYAAA